MTMQEIRQTADEVDALLKSVEPAIASQVSNPVIRTLLEAVTGLANVVDGLIDALVPAAAPMTTPAPSAATGVIAKVKAAR